jgi:hypothetical protein
MLMPVIHIGIREGKDGGNLYQIKSSSFFDSVSWGRTLKHRERRYRKAKEKKAFSTHRKN